VEELVGELADSRKLLNPALVYDRQEGQWTYPDFFTPAYIQHAEEYRSPEVCTVMVRHSLPAGVKRGRSVL